MKSRGLIDDPIVEYTYEYKKIELEDGALKIIDEVKNGRSYPPRLPELVDQDGKFITRIRGRTPIWRFVFPINFRSPYDFTGISGDVTTKTLYTSNGWVESRVLINAFEDYYFVVTDHISYDKSNTVLMYIDPDGNVAHKKVLENSDLKGKAIDDYGRLVGAYGGGIAYYNPYGEFVKVLDGFDVATPGFGHIYAAKGNVLSIFSNDFELIGSVQLQGKIVNLRPLPDGVVAVYRVVTSGQFRTEFTSAAIVGNDLSVEYIPSFGSSLGSPTDYKVFHGDFGTVVGYVPPSLGAKATIDWYVDGERVLHNTDGHYLYGILDNGHLIVHRCFRSLFGWECTLAQMDQDGNITNSMDFYDILFGITYGNYFLAAKMFPNKLILLDDAFNEVLSIDLPGSPYNIAVNKDGTLRVGCGGGKNAYLVEVR